MRVFLCSYGDSGFSLAIPMEHISSIFLLSKEEISLCQRNFSENRFLYGSENNTYISLPVLFNYPQPNIRHGIILKSADENNIILLTTEVDSELEIPNENFYSLPKAFNSLVFSSIFEGILFNFAYTDKSDGDLILLLNPAQLLQYIKKEQP
ncbi:MAG: hypothetical protein FWD24_06215 [Treponema sp.]|nr:hypothetical protein [Treponema sp.]